VTHHFICYEGIFISKLTVNVGGKKLTAIVSTKTWGKIERVTDLSLARKICLRHP
jgi:hypothetical protein